MSDSTSQLISPQDLADLLGVPLQTIYRWRTYGDGPRGLRVGRHVRYRRHDVDAWIEAHLDLGLLLTPTPRRRYAAVRDASS